VSFRHQISLVILGFRLRFSEVIPHHSAIDGNFHCEEVDVAPPKCEQLGTAKAGRPCQHDGCSLTQRKFLQQHLKLHWCEHNVFTQPLSRRSDLLIGLKPIHSCRIPWSLFRASSSSICICQSK
jgi:hypothetical protein